MMTTVEMMRRYGGSFVQALAECLQRADSENTERLLAAFPEYVERYRAMADSAPIPAQADAGPERKG